LGIKVTRDREARTLSLSQSSYIDTILSRFSLSDASPYQVPMPSSVMLSKHDMPTSPSEVAHMCKVPYREAIGSSAFRSGPQNRKLTETGPDRD
jgi:hypothetical protein